VTTPTNKFVGIYGFQPMACDPMPIVFVVLFALLESFQLLAANQAIRSMGPGQYIVMPQNESNLGGARFIPPLKRQGFSAPAPSNS